MKVQKVKSRVYKGKPYYKYRVVIPENLLQQAGIKEGDELIGKSEKTRLFS